MSDRNVRRARATGFLPRARFSDPTAKRLQSWPHGAARSRRRAGLFILLPGRNHTNPKRERGGQVLSSLALRASVQCVRLGRERYNAFGVELFPTPGVWKGARRGLPGPWAETGVKSSDRRILWFLLESGPRAASALGKGAIPFSLGRKSAPPPSSRSADAQDTPTGTSSRRIGGIDTPSRGCREGESTADCAPHRGGWAPKVADIY